MQIFKQYLDHNYSRRINGGHIEWIVVHYTGISCAKGSAKFVARSLQSSNADTSTHYLVGDDGIIQLVREKHRAWHVGPFKPENKCAACNNNSISVDLVERKLDPKSHSVYDTDWFFTPYVFDLAAQLVADIAIRNNIPLDHIVRHYDVTGKLCPRPFVGTWINDATGKVANDEWIRFVNLVSKYVLER